MSSAHAAATADQRKLVAALSDPAVHRDGGLRASLIETHISYVLLTGRHAYKIKKAVALGFLDFSTLDARRRCCADELRLNRRLAPSLYLDVVPITGTPDAPRFGGGGEPIEYAVRMREFPQDALLSRLLARGDVAAADIDALAALEPWTRREHAARSPAFDARRRDGFVRECHGDLHLANIVRVDGAPVPFDCLEFNAELRWIDTMSEVAFVVMDLDDRGRPDFARRFRNAYLEQTGDYAGLAVHRFYYVYRALVRAKVAALREGQVAAGREHDALDTELRGYVDLAGRAASRARGAIVVMHGLAGTGKSTLAQALVESTDAIRIRTDVERKRMHGVAAGARSGSSVERGLYTDEASRAVYERVSELARLVVDAGHVAIVDGAFLRRAQRDALRAAAVRLDVPFRIVAPAAPDATLRERVAKRSRAGVDASEADVAVLEHQQRVIEPLADDEGAHAVRCDGALAWDRERVALLAREIGA